MTAASQLIKMVEKALVSYCGEITERVLSKGDFSVGRKHHFVPRMYLQNFVNFDGKLWCFDKDRGEFYCGKPSALAYEKDFYRIGDINDPEGHAKVEFFWSIIESDTSPILSKIIQGEQITYKERAIFSLFISSMAYRSRAMITLMAKQASYVLNGTIQHLAEDDKNSFFESLPKVPPQFGKSARQLFLDGDVELTATKELIIPNAISLTFKTSLYPLHMRWSVLSSEVPLLTSDGAGICWSLERLMRYGGIYGYGLPDARITLPLKSDLLLYCDWGSHVYDISHSALRRGSAKKVNNVIASIAERFVYCEKITESLKRFLLKRRECRPSAGSTRFDLNEGRLFRFSPHIENFIP